MERGRQARTLRKIGPPYTPAQLRHLEDALSAAVNVAMGLDASEGRLGYIARYLAALDDGRVPAEAPRRESKLSAAQAEELKGVLAAVNKAVNASNCKVGSPLRNVAEHLLQQHRLSKAPKQAPQTAKERANVARLLAMKSSAPTAQVQSFVDPVRPSDEAMQKHDAAVEAAAANDPFVLDAKRAAKAAFAKYDADGSGTIDKEELFTVLLEAGHTNQGAMPAARRDFMQAEFAKADTDGSGAVDIDEFENFYVLICQYDEAEVVAREAFAKYEVSGDNCLQKDELFMVLLEHNAVLGDTAAEQQRQLEREFRAADINKDNAVDFQEFVHFYITLVQRKSSASVRYERAKRDARREQRTLASQSFLSADSLMDVLRKGDIKLLSAKWLMTRAGFSAREVERSGKVQRKWAPSGKDPLPLPCRQALEREAPQAFLPLAELERQLAAFREVAASTKGTERDGIDAVPVVCFSHCWEGTEHADPAGQTLQALCGELGKQMPTYTAWGFDDVGVFFDWASVHQDTLEVARTKEQEKSVDRAVENMSLLYAHRLTTVLIRCDQKVDPPRSNRGWPYYEEALTKLFKVAPPPKRYRLAHAGPTHMWPKVLRIGTDDDTLGRKRDGPPLAPSAFFASFGAKVFTRPQDREMLLADYRKTISQGFSGLTVLDFSRRSWDDDDLAVLATTLKEIACPHVTELNLAGNDLTAKGLEALGHAIAGGAIHSLSMLSLADCTALRSIPESICTLKQLTSLRLDGCIAVGALPPALGQMAGLRHLNLTHCMKLLANKEALDQLPQSIEVIQDKERQY